VKPFISIIIPTYNRSAFLPTAIQSVLDQTFDDFELIIVDDGSTDVTREIVKEYHDERMKYIFQNNNGRSAARNKGIELAKGKYICFLDDDDYVLNHYLEIIHQKVMNYDGPPTLFIAQYEIEVDGNRITRTEHPAKFPNFVKYIWDAFVPIQSICFPNQVLKENRFPVGFHIWEDKHLLLRIVLNYPLIYIQKVTSVVVEHRERSVNRINPDTFEEDSKEMIRTMDDLFAIYELQLGLFLKKGDIQKKKSQSLIGKSLDALDAGEKHLATLALKGAIKKYFHSSLVLTYLNTIRKIVFK
jgi:glycosyltransferase involved in cell wall biosynthesis